MPLLRGYDTLAPTSRQRLQNVCISDDPANELSATQGIKKPIRLVLAETIPEEARTAKTRFSGCAAAEAPETDRLATIITALWQAIEIYPAKAPRSNANNPQIVN